MSTQVEANSTQAEANSTQAETHPTQANEDGEQVIGRKRKKKSQIWKDFDEVKIGDVLKGVCKYCKSQFSYKGAGASTGAMWRHIDGCMKKKLHAGTEKRQTIIPFQPSTGVNPFIVPGAKYCNDKMREIMATAMMVHENPFNAAEHQIWVWAFEYANSEFRKVSHKTARNDCAALYEKEKKILKKQLESVSKISLTTDMWRSSHQVVEYMVITGHFIDVGWNLNKRVLSFVKVPAPRRGIDVADAIYKCLKTWGIENKVFSVSVDNASYNDSCLRSLKDNLSLTCLKERKLIIDCPTRWNSTFNMLSTALKFKIAFASYKEREPHYDFAPSLEEWNKVEKVCKLLEVFNCATHVISGSEYPTANLYLVEVWKVKVILDKADEDEDLFMREMASPMKVKFDKYWGECNLLMAIASVLDPRVKFHIVRICFPKIYKSEEVADENIKKVRSALDDLYDEYVALSLVEASSSDGNLMNSNNQSSSQANVAAVKTGFDEIMCIIQENEAIGPMKSELQEYLDDGLYTPPIPTSFSALDWWRNNSMKYKILSKMAADILAIPISTVASESTFSAGGRVIDEFRSRLSEDSVEALICGGDWFHHKYNVTKNSKVEKEEIQVNLKI
ncbi:zinc finger BED domain-containing protein DAYSLEEPER [Trifolium repens]|nr:zinc finger BED domain-containing protein DAYSLEEPER [Trifolium repens]